MSSDHRTPPYGYPDDPPCEDCGAAGGVRCFNECPTGGEPPVGWHDDIEFGSGPPEAADAPH